MYDFTFEELNDVCHLDWDWASENGRLDYIKWLHYHKKKVCTSTAMGYAIINGHLDIVKWFYYNKPFGYIGCTKNSMKYAFENGHIEVVKWLQFNKPEGYNY